MYYPYFRGKQFELMTVRECAPVMASSGFVPIIEPVRASLTGLVRALDAVREAGGAAVLIVNPQYGDHTSDPVAIEDLLQSDTFDSEHISVGILLTENMTLDEALRLCEDREGVLVTLIHAGFTEAKALAHALGDAISEMRHVFLKGGERFKRYFRSGERILVSDGFEKRSNKNHPDVEFFSALHATFKDEGMDGFGDFLIAGDEYSETGGPAYAVAIHLTFIDEDEDDDMFIHHFKSIRNETPTDPAGKFAEALQVLVQEVEKRGTKILRTSAVDEFLELHRVGHFPGLGYIKKLSMRHHIETLANFFEGN